MNDRAESKEVASLGGKLEKIDSELTNFITTYERDMRGDKKINGQKGIVNEIREIKTHIRDYPSIAWLLSHKPLQTILVILGIGLFISFAGTLIFLAAGPMALIKAFLDLLGIPIL